MPADIANILEHLRQVDAEQEARRRDRVWSDKVLAIKGYQQRRFALTYSDLLASPRYAAAARFFLEELYGPQDFGDRDAQFKRVVPALVRLFPGDVVRTVEALTRLHSLSESLDSEMGCALPAPPVTPSSYAHAWQCTGRAADRDLQIQLMLTVGKGLDRYTRKAMLRGTLHMMRGPARAAGLSHLQAFLEAGFNTFAAMAGADEFLSLLEDRERALAIALFRTDAGGATSRALLP